MQNIKKKIGDIEQAPWMIWDGRTQVLSHVQAKEILL